MTPRRRITTRAGNPLGVDLYREDWYAVYVHRAEGRRILYIGCTKNLLSRNSQHRSQAPWRDKIAEIEIDSLWPDRVSGMARERALIAEHCPPGNQQHNPKHPAHGAAGAA